MLIHLNTLEKVFFLISFVHLPFSTEFGVSYIVVIMENTKYNFMNIMVKNWNKRAYHLLHFHTNRHN